MSIHGDGLSDPLLPHHRGTEDEESSEGFHSTTSSGFHLLRLDSTADEDSLQQLQDDAAFAVESVPMSNENEGSSDESSGGDNASLVYSLFHRPFLLPGFGCFPPCAQTRFVKLLLVTIFGISFTHTMADRMNWEHRRGLGLLDIFVYEGNSISLDCLVFFSVGRLHDKKSVDHLAWLLISMSSAMYTSWISQFSFLQYAVTAYEMRCTWPWQLWLFVFAFILPVCSVSIYLHIRYALKIGGLQLKLMEMLLTVLVCFVPPAIGRTPSFEFHHWYAGLLLGMHANYDTWFSRATMSWCWGQYMNGIAIWGRDPVLTCAYAHFISKRQHCHPADDAGVSDDFWSNAHFGNEPLPDWRTCT